MVKLCFMRWRDRNQPFGYIADKPMLLGTKNPFLEPFIIVQADEKEIPKSLLTNDTVRLKIDKLQKLYPDSTEKYTDEEGKEQERVVYGYFSELGQSVDDNPPVITMEDVLYE